MFTNKKDWWALIDGDGKLCCYDDEEKCTLYNAAEAKRIAEDYPHLKAVPVTVTIVVVPR